MGGVAVARAPAEDVPDGVAGERATRQVVRAPFKDIVFVRATPAP